MKVYTLKIEWDLGINDNIYATYETAKKHLEEALEEYVELSFEEASEEGLAYIEEHEVIE